MVADHWHWKRRGRRPAVANWVIGTWAVLLLLAWRFDASLWLIGTLALFTLPACIDWISNRTSGMEIDETHLNWTSGRRTGKIPLSLIERVRLDRRLDLSIRATIITSEGQKLRLPIDATPPVNELERELQGIGIPVEIHQFALTG